MTITPQGDGLRWFSVNPLMSNYKLPEDCVGVMVRVSYSKIPTIGHYLHHEGEWQSTAPGVDGLRAFYTGAKKAEKRWCLVTEWMPLP